MIRPKWEFIFPNFRAEHSKNYLSCHHPVLFIRLTYPFFFGWERLTGRIPRRPKNPIQSNQPNRPRCKSLFSAAFRNWCRFIGASVLGSETWTWVTGFCDFCAVLFNKKIINTSYVWVEPITHPSQWFKWSCFRFGAVGQNLWQVPIRKWEETFLGFCKTSEAKSNGKCYNRKIETCQVVFLNSGKRRCHFDVHRSYQTRFGESPDTAQVVISLWIGAAIMQ